MAPIDIEYGRGIETTDGQSFFAHYDDIQPVTVEPGAKEKIWYYPSADGKLLKITLDAECPADDNGAIIKYKLSEYRYVLPNKDLDRGTIVVQEDSVVEKAVKHPKNRELVGGFRVRHVPAHEKK